MFGEEFTEKEDVTNEIFDKESRNVIKTKEDKGFDIDTKKSKTCEHLNVEESKYKFVPAVELKHNKAQIYCKKILATEHTKIYNDFNTTYSVILTDLASKFVTMKQIIMGMFEMLDEYDQEAITCGLLILFPNDDLKAKYSKDCYILEREVVRVITVVENDLKICTEIETDLLNSMDEKKLKAAQLGCLPISQLRQQIIHELDYILQRYQDHIVKVLGVAHKSGQHQQGQSLWSYIKHTGQKAIQTAKRGLYKLLTFLRRNWHWVMGTLLLTLGPLIYFGLPAIASGLSAIHTTSALAATAAPTGNIAICKYLMYLPTFGYTLYKIIGSLLISFFRLTPEERKSKLGKENAFLNKTLESNEKLIFENFGLNANTMQTGVGAFVSAPAFGTVITDEKAQEPKSKKAYLHEALEFGGTIAKRGMKYFLIYYIRTIATIAIRILCGATTLMEGITKMITELFSVSWKNFGSSLKTQFIETANNILRDFGIMAFYDKTGPIGFLLQAFELYQKYEKEGLLVVIDMIWKNTSMIIGIFQLVGWVLRIYSSLQKLLAYGNISPVVLNVAKMTPLLRSRIIDEALQTLRLPVQIYLPEFEAKPKPKSKPELEGERSNSRELLLSRERKIKPRRCIKYGKNRRRCKKYVWKNNLCWIHFKKETK